MLFTRIAPPIFIEEISNIIASGKSLERPTHCRLLKTSINFPPAITPGEEPTSLTGNFIRIDLVSFNSKKSTCCMVSFVGCCCNSWIIPTAVFPSIFNSTW